jgi:hypothetical protein
MNNLIYSDESTSRYHSAINHYVSDEENAWGKNKDKGDTAGDTGGDTGGGGKKPIFTQENISGAIGIAGQVAGLVGSAKGAGGGGSLKKDCRQQCKSAGGWLSKARRQCKKECKSRGGSASVAEVQRAAPEPTKTSPLLWIGLGVGLLVIIVVIVLIVKKKKTA